MGTVVCTVKNPTLEGKKILLVKPINRRGETTGPAQVALDAVGAGVGEDVYCVRGKEASFPWHSESVVPADLTIVGILDPYNFQRNSP